MRRLAVIMGALALVIGACGGDAAVPSTSPSATQPSSSTTAPAAASSTTQVVLTTTGGGAGGCSVTVTGDTELSWNGPDDVSAFTTDYWYTEDELRRQWGFIGDPNVPFDTAYGSGQQIVSLFLANCSGGESQLVSIFTGNTATHDSFPFGPGTYEINGGFLSSGDQPGNVLGSVLSTDTGTVWGQDGSGTLTITAWDHHHIVGTFTFEASEQFADTTRKVSVGGSFEYTCVTSTSCS